MTRIKHYFDTFCFEKDKKKKKTKMTMWTAYTHVIITRYVTTQAVRKRRKEIKRWI